MLSNTEIQVRISNVAKGLSKKELNQLCTKHFTKEIFDLNKPLFIRAPKNTNLQKKRELVKSSDNVNRWTWKYEFEKEDELYTISTQWLEKHDRLVLEWLNKYE